MSVPGEACPFGSAETYAACCGRLHAGAAAATAEQLMRARYSAFVKGETAYLLRTWRSSTRPRRLDLDSELHWLGLRVLATAGGGLFDDEGEVEFVARHERAGVRGRLHERSRFVRVGGAWMYIAPRAGN